jgi:hypothetical protein
MYTSCSLPDSKQLIHDEEIYLVVSIQYSKLLTECQTSEKIHYKQSITIQAKAEFNEGRQQNKRKRGVFSCCCTATSRVVVISQRVCEGDHLSSLLFIFLFAYPFNVHNLLQFTQINPSSALSLNHLVCINHFYVDEPFHQA